jgi:uncharacterized protein (DUF433 family)
MANLDWSQCPAVESIPGKVSGAWVLRGTRTPVKVLFENLEAGMSIEEVIEQFPVTREQIDSLTAFVARSDGSIKDTAVEWALPQQRPSAFSLHLSSKPFKHRRSERVARVSR